MSKAWRLEVCKVWVLGQDSLCFTQPDSGTIAEERQKIVRANKAVVHDHKEMDSYKLQGPCAEDPTAMVSEYTRHMQT